MDDGVSFEVTGLDCAATGDVDALLVELSAPCAVFEKKGGGS